SRSAVVEKILRLKLKLATTTESATVLKNLRKLKGLNITLDILTETGIGKTVNSLRRHKEAGELARSLVRSWKQLVSKESTRRRQKDHDEKHSSSQDISREKIQMDGEKNEKPVFSKVKNCDRSGRKAAECDTLPESQNADDFKQKNARPDSKTGSKSSSDRRRSKNHNRSLTPECSQKRSKTSRAANAKDDSCSSTSWSSEAQNGKRPNEQDNPLQFTTEPENKEHSKHKKAKTKHVENESKSEEPSLSFESYLNYDVNVLKKKVKSGGKPPPKTVGKEATKEPGIEAVSSKVAPFVASEKQMNASVTEPMTLYSPGGPLEYESPITVSHSERYPLIAAHVCPEVTKESDFGDGSEESAIFPGQRLNRKMQVYSGTKTIFLPSMMSLHQQCIRTLQNNIDLLYETGGVPFEILEPVLERCTPEQLLRIEEYNPVYIGVADHLWGKHCQRDFKEAKLQEYESWREMYMRMSEEREVKLQRLTKSIVSAHSNKPKGRQVKMAFIHTAAKPPRDVRIQQELHGTAVQQPPQLGPSQLGKRRSAVPDHGQTSNNRPRQSCTEQSRASTSAAGSGNAQDPRKKTRVAPIMAKSLKAFKKQLGRR
uniref:Elongin A, like n=2 Tax=Tetraodon nigroviridis TaxID=99883 RepID=H3DGL9_TETNG